MKDSEARRLKPPTLEHFKEFVRRVIAVPKKELDQEEAAYRRRRKAEKRKRSLLEVS
jgi:hypothetical protein